MAGKGADQHHERAFGQVEVGDQGVYDFEVKAGGDDDVGVILNFIGFSPRFQCPHVGGVFS